MFNKTLIIAGLLATMFMAGQANAALVVNTGTPTSDIGGFALDNTDWLAGQISLNHATTIGSIQTFLDDMGSGGGTFTVALYSDNNNKVGSLINSAQATYGNIGWNGAGSLNWQVAAGNYWVAFEESDLNSFVALQGAPNPLVHTAYVDGSHNGSYIPYDGLSFGVQVNEVAAVPEPETYAMILAGLGLVGFSSRRRK